VKPDEAITSYAHPEFGLQSVSSYDDQKANVYHSNNNINYRQNNPVYQIEPALNTREYYSQPRNPAVTSGAPSMYHHPQYAYIRRVRPEQPFWMKISEQVRDTFHSGFAQMAQVARPVMDPILEAGEKISQNLGFSHPLPPRAQEKVGIVIPNGATSAAYGNSNYIYPALGMLAGGAALGLGAVAMGRIFDVGSLLAMRSNSDEAIDLEHKRAIEAIRKMPTTTLFLVDDDNKHQQLTNDESTIEIVNLPASYASTDSKATNFIAIPSTDINSSIDPTSSALSSSELLPNHQRRKRN
jgi:hypothetical protein